MLGKRRCQEPFHGAWRADTISPLPPHPSPPIPLIAPPHTEIDPANHSPTAILETRKRCKMTPFENAMWGLMFFAMGLFTFIRRHHFVKSLVESSKPLWRPVGRSPESDRVNCMWGMAITTIVSVMSIIGGSLMMYSAITGKDWPLHYAKWEDIWPF